jgi:hypothetical protein
MAYKCCSRRCDGDEECTVAFLCDECNQPIDIDDTYIDTGVGRLCENCWERIVDTKLRRKAKRED